MGLQKGSFLVLIPLSGAYKTPIPAPIAAPANKANSVFSLVLDIILSF